MQFGATTVAMGYRKRLAPGKLRETIKALTSHQRERLSTWNWRGFLFELPCLSVEYKRAGKQLAVLADDSAMVYYASPHAEKSCHQLFETRAFPAGTAISSLVSESNHNTDFGEVPVPAIYPFSWKQGNEKVWLGRLSTRPAHHRGNAYPLGQKMLPVDDEEVPFLEVRSIKLFSTASISGATQS